MSYIEIHITEMSIIFGRVLEGVLKSFGQCRSGGTKMNMTYFAALLSARICEGLQTFQKDSRWKLSMEINENTWRINKK